MKERPILFNGEMVRAVLDGRKTQTRRVVKPQPDENVIRCTDSPPDGFLWMEQGVVGFHPKEGVYAPVGQDFPCPYGVPGDRLWVRETWATGSGLDAHSPKKIGELCLDAGNQKPWAPILYKADGATDNADTLIDFGASWGKSRPKIFMPRWASRILLEVVSVRVERVQHISKNDILSEGVTTDTEGQDIFEAWVNLWDSINLQRGYGWDVNPWAWVVEFKQI